MADSYHVVEVTTGDGEKHYEIKTKLWGVLPFGYVQDVVFDSWHTWVRRGRSRWKTKEDALKWIQDKMGEEVVGRKVIVDVRAAKE